MPLSKHAAKHRFVNVLACWTHVKDRKWYMQNTTFAQHFQKF